jgi:hypothetical protein
MQFPIPYQLIAKAYTEGLGRVPDPQELVQKALELEPQGCRETTLATWLKSVLVGREAMGLPLTDRQRVQTAYRLLLNRDPDLAGWNYYATLPFPQAVDAIMKAPEWRANIYKICTSQGKGFGFGATPIDAATPGTALQAQLLNTPPGGTVTFSGRVEVAAPLVIPAGVTLRSTAGHYAQQGTLLRNGGYPEAIVRLMAGSALRDVVVDGRKKEYGYIEQAMNIEVAGSGATVQGVRSQNTAGWTYLFCSPHAGNVTDVAILDNTILGYANSRKPGATDWADGISLACTSANAKSNKIVDATDVGIIAFDPYATGVGFTIAHNYILNVGNDTWGMYGLDQGDGAPKDFSRTIFDSNLVFTAGQTKARVGMLNGARTWRDGRTSFTAPTYSGNSGYIQYELFGGVSDVGPIQWEPTVNLHEMPPEMPLKCPPLQHAVAGTDRIEGCL